MGLREVLTSLLTTAPEHFQRHLGFILDQLSSDAPPAPDADDEAADDDDDVDELADDSVRAHERCAFRSVPAPGVVCLNPCGSAHAMLTGGVPTLCCVLGGGGFSMETAFASCLHSPLGVLLSWKPLETVPLRLFPHLFAFPFLGRANARQLPPSFRCS